MLITPGVGTSAWNSSARVAWSATLARPECRTCIRRATKIGSLCLLHTGTSPSFLPPRLLQITDDIRGETGVGTWRVIVKDTNVNGHTGAFINWRLNLWSEAVDGPNQPLHPSPGDPMVYITEVAVISTTSSPLPTPAVIHSPSDWGSATRPWRQPDMGVSGTLLALLTLCSALVCLACNFLLAQ